MSTGRSSSLFRLKTIVEQPVERRLARTLSWPHLVALGVGAIVGTGILTLIGVGADRAGPAVILSFVVAGTICACAALAYAEMATMIPASGSAYTYSYAVLGEVIAWVASTGGVTGQMVRDLMLACVEVRFGGLRTTHPVQWLADNGSAFTAAETLSFAAALGLVPCFTPVCSPESNG